MRRIVPKEGKVLLPSPSLGVCIDMCTCVYAHVFGGEGTTKLLFFRLPPLPFKKFILKLCLGMYSSVQVPVEARKGHQNSRTSCELPAMGAGT